MPSGDLDDSDGQRIREVLGAVADRALRDQLGPDPLAPTEQPDPPAPDMGYPKPGEIICSKWRISKALGRGAFGQVFSARHLALDRDEAIKFLHPHLAADDDLRDLFAEEAKRMAELHDAHLVYVHDSSEHNGLPFFAMELLEGRTLQQLLTEEPLSLPSFHELAEDIVRGVAEVHARGVLHRDIKPANIFVLEDDRRIKLLDFGLAKTAMHMSSQRANAGTPLYMAPELLADHTVASYVTDVYSTGIVLYQMLTGSVPFRPTKNEDYRDFGRRIQVSQPSPPRLDRPDLPEAVEQIVLRAIDSDPSRRPQSAEALVAALVRVRAGTEPASTAVGRARGHDATLRDPSTALEGSRSRSARRIAVIAVLLLTTVAALVIPGVLWPWGEPPSFPEAGGILVTTPAWASAEAVERFDASCEALRGEAPRRVQCVRVSWMNGDPTRYRAWALSTSAAMAIHVGDGATARLELTEELTALPLLEVLPSLELRDTADIEALAPLLATIPLLGEPHRAGEASSLEVPHLDPARVGYKWATVAALLRAARATDTTEETIAELRILARCDGAREGVPEDERFCDIAQYLLASLELSSTDTCPRIEPALMRLARDGSSLVSALALVLRAECIASTDPTEAAKLLLEALSKHPGEGSCEMVTVLPFAPILVGGSPAEQELLRRIDAFEPDGCEGAAAAIARRGDVLRAQQRWDRAALDFYEAYRLDPSYRIYLVAWAEARLRAPLDDQARRQLRAELRRDLFSDPVAPDELPLAVTVAYLRWLVTREPSDATSLLELHAHVPEGRRPLLNGACDGLRSLACADKAPCSVDVLRAPKTSAQGAELARALGVVGG